MRRRVLVGVAVLAAGAIAAWAATPLLVRARAPIKVGLLHSRTGPMAISEASMIEAETLAIEEINAGGGLLGRRVEGVVADGKSDPATFAREAERLITEEKVSAIFGCWSSACRKSVKTVVERANHLLVYPVAYEGMEQSPNIIYCGAAPNQQIIPTVKWCHDVLKARTYFLIGTDSVWPHGVHAVVKDQLTALGATLSGEEFLPFGSPDVDAAIARAVKAKPDLILSTIEGDTNLAFYNKLRGVEGGSAVPVVSFTVTEEELRVLPVKRMAHDYAVGNYFQSIDRPENHEFVKAFQTRFGADRVTSDAIDTAYNGVRMWAQAVRESETDAPAEVRTAFLRQSLNAPEGVISIDRETHHTWRPFYLGRVRNDGQVEVLWSAEKPIRPTPFPFSRTRQEWETFLEELYAGWGGNWSPPVSRTR